MMIVFPVLLFGGFLLTKQKPKKSNAYQLIETGSMAMLPKDGQPLVTVDLSRHQMLEIVTADSPSLTWTSKVDGKSVRVDRVIRSQDPSTNTTIFQIKANSLGDSIITFEKLASDGRVLDRRHLRIAVMG